MSEIGRLLLDLHRLKEQEGFVALALSLKDGQPLFAVLYLIGSQVADVLGTGATPEEACRTALDALAAAVVG